MASRPVCIIGAMEEEMREFHAHAQIAKVWHRGAFSVQQGMLMGIPVVMAKCGVGKVFASMITQFILDEFHPASVISTGVAGSIADTLKIGDVVVSRDCAQHDMDARALGFERGRIPYTDLKFFAADQNLMRLALTADLENPNHKIVSGRILTGDQFLSGLGDAARQLLIEELEGDAVDMESAAIAQVCCLNEIPFVSIRTISDYADHSAHIDFNQFLPVVAHNSFYIVKHLLSK